MRATLLVFFFGYLTYGQSNLDKYLWKNRVVVIFKTVHNDLKVKEQLEAFKEFPREIEDRQIIILAPKKVEKSKFLERFGLDNDYSGLILLGKDGGIKLKETLITKPQLLFDLIDAMPMRRAEMRNTSKKPN
ncbi:MAG: DUF4174 domain-containing protein [Bacteroidota bacterium]